MEAIQIGLDQFHYASLLTDSSAGCSYDTPAAVPGIITANVKANGSIDTKYADDGPAVNASSIGRQELDIEFTNLPLALRAILLGQTRTSGVTGEKANDVPADLAIGFRSLKSNGQYRYIWYVKGNFALPDDSYKTKEDKTNFNTQTMKFVGVRRDYDGYYKFMADEDDPAVAAATITNWFNAVPIAITAPDALTLVTVPADAAVDVAINVSPTFTYNNAITDAQVIADHFYLLKASDGSKVAAALSIDADKKVVTLNPTADLTNAAEYILIASGLVTDIYGQKLAAGTTVTNFTTVS
ncbi:MAG: Ig-like domain-containing protein [Syntrophomonadaceae bacterium]|nr:Ig-like domain-containing protein [Syntrophomonadaceae bacterium]